MTRPPTALTIAGSDSGGGAGLQADLKTFLACRVHGMSAVTAVTAQHSRGVVGVHPVPGSFVAEQIVAVGSDIGVDAAKTGMLANRDVVDAVAEVLGSGSGSVDVGPLVVDPVCASQHGDPLLAPDAVEALTSRLFPLASLVTPNLPEVKVLLGGYDVRDRSGMREAARRLFDFGPRWVLVKGGHLDDPVAIDILYDGTSFAELSAPRHPSVHTHGSGDTLAAATTAALARGLEMPEAVAAGKDFITAAVDGSFPLGSGRGPVGHFWRIQPS
ncbi:MAG: bifunctional hydroxymethylpyrimidine kinase/phosphomethylpyrimidine kinase [Frankiaceae bacterium]|nr:bifunctional hydroxymethylpyrimidine kinase/phosphomethylpyrimidine kinase [Frankiaceae bacterium]